MGTLLEKMGAAIAMAAFLFIAVSAEWLADIIFMGGAL